MTAGYKIIVLFFAAALLIGAAFFWGKSRQILAPSLEGAIKVTTTIYPLYEFAKAVVGERGMVSHIVPVGAEPHDFDPAPRDIINIYASDVFIKVGDEFDAWTERLAADLTARNVTVLDLTEALGLEERGLKDAAGHADPHFWLDPIWVTEAVEKIAIALAERDPEGGEVYVRNAAAYAEELFRLDSEYRSRLYACRLRDIITTHAAFGYMAARYDFRAIPLAGLSHDEEPSPAYLAEVVRLALERGIKYVFIEPLASDRFAEVVRREIGGELLELNPAEGLTAEEGARGEDYFTVMRRNLQNLARAMDCD